MTDTKKMAERLRAEPWALLHDAADMIEALQAEIDRERKSRQDAQIENEALKARLASAPLQQTPLDDAKIYAVFASTVKDAEPFEELKGDPIWAEVVEITRKIEAAHGIE